LDDEPKGGFLPSVHLMASPHISLKSRHLSTFLADEKPTEGNVAGPRSMNLDSKGNTSVAGNLVDDNDFSMGF